MLKVKIFDSYSKEDVEKKVNDFLDKEKRIGIVQMDHKVTPVPAESGKEISMIYYSVIILYTYVSNLKLINQ